MDPPRRPEVPEFSDGSDSEPFIGAPDLFVLPELGLTGYTIKDDVQKLAEPIDGPSMKRLSSLSQELGCGIVIGFAERDKEVRGHIFNSAAIILPDGSIDAYRKCHLANFGPFDEKRYFHAGRKLPVFKTPWGNIGLQICYDIFFPEAAKAMALKGADIIIDISASPTTTRKFFEMVMPVRAVENTVFTAYCNLVGTEGNLQFWGGNSVHGPRGDLKVRGPYFEETIVKAEIDLDELDIARPMRPTLRDTRTDIAAEFHDAVKGV